DQQQHSPGDGRVQTAKRFLEWLTYKDKPARRLYHRIGGEHLTTLHVARDRGLLDRPGDTPRRLTGIANLAEGREIRSPQNQTDLRVGDELTVSIDNVGIPGGSNADLGDD